MDSVDSFAFHCNNEEQNYASVNLWMNLPQIANDLLTLLSAYKPGWNNRHLAVDQERARGDLMQRTRELLAFMREP